MGLDFHAVNFLRYAHRYGGFGEAITIARQELHVNRMVLEGLLPLRDTYVQSAYCEELLKGYFGAASVESVDNSDYEQATHVHNMNDPLPNVLKGRYDTVMDIGCLEHVYNAPQALLNCSMLCRPGGQIIHVLPTNNYCGHGFWQFSPELFFSLYSSKNGYRDTEVFVADFTCKKQWFKVRPPSNGTRVNILSDAELYVMVRTVKAGSDVSHADVQQSDYVFEWENEKTLPEPMESPSGARGAVMRSRLVYDTLFPLYHRFLRRTSADRLTRRNPGLEVFDLASL